MDLPSFARSFKSPYVLSYVGGVFIGISATLFLFVVGRIMGISGMVGQIVDDISQLHQKGITSAASRYAFISGILLGGYYFSNSIVNHFNLQHLYHFEPFALIPTNPAVMFIAGTLIGIGTRLGSGCTSGHGVCGLGRLSKRSFIAVLCFFSTGIVTSTLSTMYFPYLFNDSSFHYSTFSRKYASDLSQYGILTLSTILLLLSIHCGWHQIQSDSLLTILPSFIFGVLFCYGLIISGMTNSMKVRNFLDVSSFIQKNNEYKWDPSLAFVMLGALTITLTTFKFIITNFKKPLLNTHYNLPTQSNVDQSLVVGSILFGLGWGMSGICPGPGLVCLTNKENSGIVWIWFIGLIIGMKMYTFIH